ncbi:MAG TPA: MFS transporter [Solirubrobacteraceae bacterium]|nr:MFS transporter [Solirubrobacteraceae bacterium]
MMDRKWWTLVAVCIGTFMLLLDITIVNVALPKIQSGLHSSFADLQWVVDAYALTLAALLLTSGSVADLLGRRRIFAVGLVLFSAASLLSGLAQSPLMLNLSRGLQGIGGAMMFATSLALLGNAFRGRERGIAFGVWGAVTGAAVSIGPVVGGALTDALSWRWIFLVNVPIGAVALALTLAKVDESRDPQGARLDLPGFVTFTAALAALVLGLIESSQKGWGSALVEGCLIASAVLIVVFVAVEHRQRAPMLDLSLFRRPAFDGASLVAFALSASIFAMFLYITLYLQDLLGFSPLGSGLRLLTLSGAVFLTSAIAGRLTTVVPVRFLMGAGLALVGVSLLLMRGLTATSHWTHLLPGFVVGGVGIGLINPPLASTAIAVVPPRQAGMGSGINSTFRQVGIATGIAALGSIFSSAVRSHVTSGLAAAHQTGAHAITTAIADGQIGQAIAHVPPQARPVVAEIVRTSFVAGLNEIFLVAAIVALVGAAGALVLIRSRDFVAQTDVPADLSSAAAAGSSP